MLNDVHIEQTPINLKQCIENARCAVNVQKNIVFEEIYVCKDITIRASEVHIVM